jgi:hypothetical protein
MRDYLESNGIEVVDVEVIQYGDKEWSVKKADATGEIMPVLVDFAHGKPMFIIHTDHHDRQAGAEETGSKSFRQSRSNVETLSQIIPKSDLFPTEDVATISMVDSADFAKNEITPDIVMNYVYKFDKDISARKNRMLLGLVTNKLLLAFKNKPNFLETLVMEAKPSLLNLFLKIKEIMEDKNYAPISSLEKNKEDYIEKMKDYPDVQGNIIVQYGGGSMMKPGSYDRYTPFKNNPEADFLVIAWPLGLLQASCNPFKKERELKGVNLGEIAQEVLSKWEGQLKDKEVPLSTIKWVSEGKIGEESVGFTFKDFAAIYGEKFLDMKDGAKYLVEIKSLMEKPSEKLSEEEWGILDQITVPAWDIIQANSGGHKCITNISGLNFFGRGKRPPQGKYKYDPEKEDAAYIKFLKMLQNEFVRVLQEKIRLQKGNLIESLSGSKKYYIGNSEIHGKGVFAKQDLEENEEIGLLHTIHIPKIKYDFTELGRLYNHSNEPNCYNDKIGNQRFLKTKRKIRKGEELTADYRLQPDLEQPEGFKFKNSIQ